MSTETIGRRRILDAVCGGEDVRQVLALLLDVRNQIDADLCAGALGGLLDVFETARAAGYVFSFSDREVDATLRAPCSAICTELLRGLNTRDDALRQRTGRVLSGLCAAADAMRRQVRVGTPASQAEVPALRVEIVSLPNTTSVQTVERDEHDDIRRTVTTTTLAAAS